MRVLFVSCLLPYPTVPHGGGTDLFHLIETLGRRHEVHLVSLVLPSDEAHVDEMRPYVASLQVVAPALTWRQKLRNALREPPWRWGRRARAEVRAAIRRAVTAGIDVAQFEWTETARFVDAVTNPRVVTVLDEVDVSFRPLARALGPDGHRRRRVRTARERELAWCRRFDAVLTRSEADQAALEPHLPHTRLHVFQPWTHVDDFRSIGPETREPGTVLFFGAMDRDENADAVLWFYRECWPRVREAVPTARLVIAGHAPLPRVARLAADPGVVVTGHVPACSVRPVYARADVCIAPSLVGGGVLNKVIDGMAAGRPVVTTTVGNEGVAVPSNAVCVADEPGDFADAVVRLLRDPDEWARVATASRAFVQRTYRWDDNVARLEALYHELSLVKTASLPMLGGICPVTDAINALLPERRAALAERLLVWAEAQKPRNYPWRAEPRTPYRVWVAEVMLQQTRTETVGPYYERFLARFPTVEALAAALLDDVLKAWEGLGYYARARNLYRAAGQVAAAGAFPSTYEDWRALPGVGDYTAGAVLSLAFGQDVPAVDGNGRRVLARLCDVEDDVAKAATQRKLRAIAAELLPPGRAGAFNEALMDLGAAICTPRAPRCDVCPWAADCLALAQGRAESLPVRAPRRPVPHYDVTAAVVQRADCLLIAQRRPEDMLGGLWEFPGGKCQPGESLADCLHRELREELGIEVAVGEPVVIIPHAYSHFRITLYAFRCTLVSGEPRPIGCADVRWVRLDELDAYAFPVTDLRIIAALRNEEV